MKDELLNLMNIENFRYFVINIVFMLTLKNQAAARRKDLNIIR